MAAGGRHARSPRNYGQPGNVDLQPLVFQCPNNVIWLTRANPLITGACIGNGIITLM